MRRWQQATSKSLQKPVQWLLLMLLLAFAAADADFCWQRKYLRERCGASFV